MLPFLQRGWTVLLLGGSSGSGKTCLAEQMGVRFGVPWLQVDDLRLALQGSRATLPRGTEALYFFLEHPDVWSLPPERLRDALIAVGETMAPAIAIIIEHHVATAKPLVIEGDGILPSLVARPDLRKYMTDGRLRAIFLAEFDEVALLDRVRGRAGRQALHLSPEPTAAERNMARMNVLYGQWLAAEAGRHGLPVLEPRPWDTAVARVMLASNGGATI